MGDSDSLGPSPNLSDPISDLDSQEMDKLMADLAADDDDILNKGHARKAPKSPKPSTGVAKSPPIKPTIKTPDKTGPQSPATPTSKDVTPKKVTFGAPEKEELKDDWDAAADLLKDDSASKPPGSSRPSSVQGGGGGGSSNRSLSPGSGLSSLDPGTPGKSGGDISKFVGSLFADDNDATTKAGTGSQPPQQQDFAPKMPAARKSKSSDLFGSDDDDFFGSFTKGADSGVKTGAGVTSGRRSGGFMDDLLSGGKQEEKKTPESAKSRASREFVLDSKYKSPSSGGGGGRGSLGGYTPSGDSAVGRSASKAGGNVDDIFGAGFGPGSSTTSSSGGDGGSRQRPRTAVNKTSFQVDDEDIVGPTRRRPVTARAKQPFQVNDDDILGNFKKSPPQQQSESSPHSSGGSVSQQHASPGQQPPSQPTSGGGSDWLGSMLASKSSPAGGQTTPTTAQKDATAAPLPPSQVAITLPAVALPSLTLPAVAASAMQSQALAHAGFTASTELQVQLQEQLEQQQQQAVKQLQQQQLQLEEQFAFQTKQQINQQKQMIELLAKQQEAAVGRYQSALASVANLGSTLVGVGGRCPGCGALLQGGDAVAEHSTKLKAEQLATEVELLRSHHKWEIKLREELSNGREQLLRREQEAEMTALEKKITILQEELDAEISQHKDRLKRLQEGYEEQLRAQERLRDQEVKTVKSSVERNAEAEAVMQRLSSNTNDLSKLSETVHLHSEQAQQTLRQTIDAQKKQVARLEAQLASTQLAAQAEQQRLTQLVQRLEERMGAEAAALEERGWRLEREERKMKEERKILEEETQQFQGRKAAECQSLATAHQNLEEQKRQLQQQVARLQREQAIMQVTGQGNTHPERPSEERGSAFPRVAMEALMQEVQEERLTLRRLRDAYREEKEDFDRQREQMEQEKLEINLKATRVRSDAAALQLERQRAGQELQQLEEAAAQQRQRMEQLQRDTHVAHAAKMEAAQERDRVATSMTQLQAAAAAQQLCNRCGGPNTGPAPTITTAAALQSLLQHSSALAKRNKAGLRTQPASTQHQATLATRDLRPAAVLARLAAAREAETRSLLVQLSPEHRLHRLSS